jgi:siroheme synthase-like protein
MDSISATSGRRSHHAINSIPMAPTPTSSPGPARDSGQGRAASERPPAFPVEVVLDGASCLVVGAGPVGARKARGLLASGARVTVVAPRIGVQMEALADGDPSPGTLVVEVRPYRSPEAADHLLVVSATGDPAVDAVVTADAVAAGTLVNRADTGGDDTGPTAGSVRLPAVHRDGPVTLTVSTAGSGPALALWLRARAAAALGPDVAVLARLVDEARTALQDTGRATDSIDWGPVLDEVAPLVAEGRLDEARRSLARRTGV